MFKLEFSKHCTCEMRLPNRIRSVTYGQQDKHYILHLYCFVSPLDVIIIIIIIIIIIWLYSPIRALASPFWSFLTITFLRGWIVSPAPNPEDQVSVFMTPGDRVTQLYPQALGTHFSPILRHAWVTVGLFFNPGHHTGRMCYTVILIPRSRLLCSSR
jgi:hypothetical protein